MPNASKINKVDSELLKILCCPKCKSSLKLNKNKSMLKCGKCRKSYAVKDGVPYMLIKK